MKGYERNVFGHCEKMIVCGENEMIENGKCICKPGHRKNSFGYCEYIKCAYD